MTNQQSSRNPSRMEQILDLLVEEIEERIWVRRYRRSPAPSPAEPAEPLPSVVPAVPSPQPEIPPAGAEPAVQPPPPALQMEPLAPEPEQEIGRLEPELEMELPPMATGPSHAARLMGRLALGLLIAIVLINIPLNRHGTTLATAMPDSPALVVRDGLVLKEADDEEIYVYQDGKLRWISSMDAFEHFGYTWGDVHVVEDGYLDKFEMGTPLHVLLKCQRSPHIYRLEGGAKRWIRDIQTFEEEGHVWDDVRFVTCDYLRDLPDGETIPPDSGPPPQP